MGFSSILQECAYFSTVWKLSSMAFPSLPLWLLAIFFVELHTGLNFLSKYLELISQAFYAHLIHVAKMQAVLGRYWKEWKISPSLILYRWEMFLIYIFLNSFSETNFSISQIRQFIVSDFAYFIVTRDNSFPRAACNSPAFERVFSKTKMTAKSMVFTASQQGSDIWLSFAPLMFLPL